MRRLLAIAFLSAAACASTPTDESDGDSTISAISGTTFPVRASLQKEISARVVAEKMPKPAYFFIGFGYEGKSNPASQSHTFASFVKVDEDGDQLWSTISWLPETFAATQTICIFKDYGEAAKETILGNPCQPVKARDYDLAPTVSWAVAADRTLGIWGPYHVTPELYDLGQQRIRFLKSGAVAYMADDRDTRKNGEAGTAFNCMHAVSDLPGHFHSGTLLDRFSYGNWGINGTKDVMSHYESMQNLFYDRVDANDHRTFSNH